jgi:hypothetical protein
MGNWNINIQGIGAHHNLSNPKDAEKMAAKFVLELKDAGHSIEHCDFTYGGKENLSNVTVPIKSIPE